MLQLDDLFVGITRTSSPNLSLSLSRFGSPRASKLHSGRVAHTAYYYVIGMRSIVLDGSAITIPSSKLAFTPLLTSSVCSYSPLIPCPPDNSPNPITASLPSTDGFEQRYVIPVEAPSRDQWVPDEAASHCMVCQQQRFSMVRDVMSAKQLYFTIYASHE